MRHLRHLRHRGSGAPRGGFALAERRGTAESRCRRAPARSTRTSRRAMRAMRGCPQACARRASSRRRRGRRLRRGLDLGAAAAVVTRRACAGAGAPREPRGQGRGRCLPRGGWCGDGGRPSPARSRAARRVLTMRHERAAAVRHGSLIVACRRGVSRARAVARKRRDGAAQRDPHPRAARMWRRAPPRGQCGVEDHTTQRVLAHARMRDLGRGGPATAPARALQPAVYGLALAHHGGPGRRAAHCASSEGGML